MNRQSKFAVIGIVAALLIGTTSLSATAFAGKPNDPNCFGDSASDQGGALGEHSRDGGAAGDHPYDGDGKKGRSGIGNIGEDAGLTPGSKHPSDLADALGGNCN
jgi:hypothetical protein